MRWYGSHPVACAWHPHFPSRSTRPPPRSREPSAHVVTAGCASLLRISCTRVRGTAYVVSHCLAYLRFHVHPLRHCPPLCVPPHPSPLLLGSHDCSHASPQPRPIRLASSRRVPDFPGTRLRGPAYVVSHCLSYLRFHVHPLRHCTPLCAPPHPGPLLLGSHACSPAIFWVSRGQAVETPRTIPTTSIA